MGAYGFDAGGRDAVIQAIGDASERYPLRGAIGRIGTQYTLNLELLDPDDRVLDRRSYWMGADLDVLLGEMSPMVVELFSAHREGEEGRDAGAVREVFRASSTGLKHCYEEALKLQPGLVVKAEVAFKLVDGRAQTITAMGTPPLPDGMEACLVDEVREWLFPSRLQGDVAWPLRFGHPAEHVDD